MGFLLWIATKRRGCGIVQITDFKMFLMTITLGVILVAYDVSIVYFLTVYVTENSYAFCAFCRKFDLQKPQHN